MSEWDDLRIVLAVKRRGLASRAAEDLNLSHATVSRRIAELERRYGVNLVDRSGHRWILTPLGTQIAERAERMEAEALEVQRLSQAHSNSRQGVVKISVPQAALAPLVAPALSGFCEAHPGIQIIFSLDDQVVSLRERKADIAVRFTFDPDPNLIGEKVLDVEWGLYAAKELTEVCHRSDDQNKHPGAALILSDPADRTPKWAEKNFASLEMKHFVYGFSEKAALATAGFGITELPVIVGQAHQRLVRLQDVDHNLQTQLWILANADTRTSGRINLAKKFLVSGLKRLASKQLGLSI